MPKDKILFRTDNSEVAVINIDLRNKCRELEKAGYDKVICKSMPDPLYGGETIKFEITKHGKTETITLEQADDIILKSKNYISVGKDACIPRVFDEWVKTMLNNNVCPSWFLQPVIVFEAGTRINQEKIEDLERQIADLKQKLDDIQSFSRV